LNNLWGWLSRPMYVVFILRTVKCLWSILCLKPWLRSIIHSVIIEGHSCCLVNEILGTGYLSARGTVAWQSLCPSFRGMAEIACCSRAQARSSSPLNTRNWSNFDIAYIQAFSDAVVAHWRCWEVGGPCFGCKGPWASTISCCPHFDLEGGSSTFPQNINSTAHLHKAERRSWASKNLYHTRKLWVQKVSHSVPH